MFSPDDIAKIKKIVDRTYKQLEDYAAGPSEERQSKQSVLEEVYSHILGKRHSPETRKKFMRASIDHLNEMLRQLLTKQKSEVASRIEGILRETNTEARYSELQHKQDRKLTVQKLKQKLRDYSGDASRNWTRIAATETSNAVGHASIDRIIDDNEGSDFGQIYVYRTVVQDGALCKWCKRFYLDGDGTPAVYSLAHLMANNTNYGKRTDAWGPVAGATHPNERCSPTIQLKAGWRVLAGGGQEYIGLNQWNDYIKSKVRS